jgi:hypothetical protein
MNRTYANSFVKREIQDHFAHPVIAHARRNTAA